MPAVFIGHGSPENALESNKYTKAWESLSQKIPRPKAILCISAHWFTDKTVISNSNEPQLIYDFYGFKDELYNVKYPVKGSSDLAEQVKDLLKPILDLEYDNTWGIDHGAWVPIMKMFPEADIPVVQLSLDYNKKAESHYQLAKALKPLREQGVLIIASGNIVHNLGVISFDDVNSPYDWAEKFDNQIANLITNQQHQEIIRLSEASLSVPTPEHYLPLLYILALQEETETMTSFVDGIVYKSISMRSYLLS